MRIKKGFTLAEILIVLMVIGVIATMTVPSLMKGVNEATYKTAYKKAFNAVTNIAAVEKISGQLPATSTQTAAENFFASLNSNLSVKEYYPMGNTGDITKVQDIETKSTVYDKTKVGSTEFKLGPGTKSTGESSLGKNKFSSWMITEDGLAYAVTYTGGAGCGKDGKEGTKAYINSKTTMAEVHDQACLIVAVDVNGIMKGPNILEAQVSKGIASNAKLDTLVSDRYYIYIGTDGAATGPKGITVSGRLLSDMK